jgi:hypothetical protein
MGYRDRRAARPSLERIEARELLSGVIAAMVASEPPRINAYQALATHMSANGSLPVYSGNTGSSTGNGLTNNSSSPLLGNGAPTPAELARETFKAAFSGRFYTGPGRFSSQGTTYYYRGLGGSTFFLHGDFNMAVVTPTDPNAPFLGEAVLNDKSTNSAGIQGLILSGARTDVDSLGRPTHLTFTADPNVYSGVFFVDAAAGTVDIRYGAKGAITASFHGLVYTSGLTNPLVNQDLYARNGRPLRFHPSAARH